MTDKGWSMLQKAEGGWLLLIHQLPPKPAYFRVKVGRRLQRLGAVAIKNSVYVLPQNESSFEDLQWVLREIVNDGGDASLCEARFVEGLSYEQIQSLFQEARNADYSELSEEARRLAKGFPKKIDDDQRAAFEAQVARLRKRLSEVEAIDFFDAPSRQATEGLIGGLEAKLAHGNAPAKATTRVSPASYRGRTWVTRTGIFVDRMASAWLIRRFIDQDARFKFVSAKIYQPAAGELRFDMFEAEFTHVGDLCTFEVLLERFSLASTSLHAIAEIVHDLDVKDGKFGRQDALGFERIISGIAMAHKEDSVRLERASAVLDDLFEFFDRKRRKP